MENARSMISKPAMNTMHAKVPEVTFGFWIIKIFATTLGETAGDMFSMSLNLGYLLSTGIFSICFAGFVIAQMRATYFHPLIYWLTIIATTTLGTTLADFADRSLGIGYAGGSLLLSAALLVSLFVWHRTLGSINIGSITTKQAEFFYWMTILFSQTLGTALGDWTVEAGGFGYTGGAIVFGTLLIFVAGLWYWTSISRTIIFWIAFILTRPLGAVVGDFLDKPHASGGLALSRFGASGALIAGIVLCLLCFKQKPARAAH